MNYSRITSEEGMVMKSPPVMIPLSGRVTGRASEPSRTRVDDGSGYGTFRGWRLGSLGFSRGNQYIGGRAMSVGARGAHTLWRRVQVAHPPGVAASSAHFVSTSDSVYVTKIGPSAFVSSNSENISRTTFLKYKNSRKQELALWHLVNRLDRKSVV